MVIDQYLREVVIFLKNIPSLYLKIGPNFEKLQNAVFIKFASEKEALPNQYEDLQSESSSSSNDVEETYASSLKRKWIYSNNGGSQMLTYKEDWESSSSNDEYKISSSLSKRKFTGENIAQAAKNPNLRKQTNSDEDDVPV